MLNVRMKYTEDKALEIWKEVKDFPGYEVSTFGNVFSKRKNGLVFQRINTSGYLEVSLCNESGGFKKRAHRLVIETFRGAPPTSKHECAHNDGTRRNNHISNLRWATRRENALDRIKHGTMRNVLSEAQVREVFLSREPNKILAEKFKVTPGAIANVRLRRTWAHLDQAPTDPICINQFKPLLNDQMRFLI